MYKSSLKLLYVKYLLYFTASSVPVSCSEHLDLKVHMHEILYFVFHIFLASLNKRQGWGPELQKFCYVKCLILVHNWIIANSE
jgi:hypothetical protein